MSAEEYRSRVEMAERYAKTARDAGERKTFLEIAKLWRDLAGRDSQARAERQNA